MPRTYVLRNTTTEKLARLKRKAAKESRKQDTQPYVAPKAK